MPPPRGFLNETLPGEPVASWMEATLPTPPERPAHAGDLSVDVAIVGAGYAGLSAALTLAEKGARVAVIEAHRVGWGASGRNGGHVDSLPRREAAFYEAAVGRDDTAKIIALAQDAAALVRRRIRDHAIPCELVDGQIVANHHAALDASVAAEVARLRDTYGVDSLEYLPPERRADWVRGVGYSGGVLDRAGGALNPLAFARGLAAAAEAAGVRIVERTRVIEVDPGRVAWTDPSGTHAAQRARLETRSLDGPGAVSADRVLLCLGAYHDRLEPDYAARVAPVISLQIATAPLGERLTEILPGGVAVSDTRNLLNYFRPTSDGRLIFGGAKTSRRRPPRDIAARVRPRLAALFPALRDAPVDYAWGGCVGLSRHRAPVFRRPSPRLLSIGGWSGSGVHMATLGGEIAADAVLGAPARFDLLARAPAPPFSLGARLRRPVLALALAWLSLQDRRG